MSGSNAEAFVAIGQAEWRRQKDFADSCVLAADALCVLGEETARAGLSEEARLFFDSANTFRSRAYATEQQLQGEPGSSEPHKLVSVGSTPAPATNSITPEAWTAILEVKR